MIDMSDLLIETAECLLKRYKIGSLEYWMNHIMEYNYSVNDCLKIIGEQK